MEFIMVGFLVIWLSAAAFFGNRQIEKDLQNDEDTKE